jgi:hypothetical protein
MDQKLLLNIDEYRQWAWKLSIEHDKDHVDEALGLRPVRECWDTDKDGNPIDERGRIIPKDTAKTVKIANRIKELNFPVIAVYSFFVDDWRGFSNEICFCEFIPITQPR